MADQNGNSAVNHFVAAAEQAIKGITTQAFLLVIAVCALLDAVCVFAIGVAPSLAGLLFVALLVFSLLVVGLVVVRVKPGPSLAPATQAPVNTVQPVVTGLVSMTQDLALYLDIAQRAFLLELLERAAQKAAPILQVPPEMVRANIFGIGDDGRVRMLPGVTHNMRRPFELTISMARGEGSSGRCIDYGQTSAAVWKSGWGPDSLADPAQGQKVHPDLRWILSIPIKPTGMDEVVWVLNLDGLSFRPKDADFNSAAAAILEEVTYILGLVDIALIRRSS